MTYVRKKNEVYLKVETEQHIHKELSDYFCFDVPNAKFMPHYKKRVWDGKIRLYSPGTGEIYCGLYDYLEEFFNNKGYEYVVKQDDHYGIPQEDEEYVTPQSTASFVGSLGLPFKARDYQLRGIYQALKSRRKLLLSPTGSGKSLIIYALVRWYMQKGLETLIIVPTTSLVEQMYKDFEIYGWKASAYCHKIRAGREKYVDKPVVISTWQSIYKEGKAFFDRFDAVIGDEAHLYKAKSLSGILTKMVDTKYRIGLTGTLDGLQTHQLVLEGLFGSVDQVTKTKDLQKKGHLTPLKVNIILLKHGWVPFDYYQQEIEYLCMHERRNKFISKLAMDTVGNTLILFNYVEKHGEPLYKLINSYNSNRLLFFIHGGIDTEDREEARRITESQKDAIIIASYGTFSTGINIRNLHNVIFASPSKSRVRNLQSIGRVLRKGENKSQATLYDIADDCTKGSYHNYTFRHLIERMKIYESEEFDYEVTKVRFKND